jgi:hypothetical protein
MDRELAVPDGHVASSTPARSAGGEVQRERTRGLPDGCGGNVVGDHVDQTTDRVPAVQQSGRSAHHFDPARCRGVDVHTVVTGLAGQIAHAQSVLDDQHAVAVQPADHWACGPRTETAQRDARLGLERCANRALQLDGQVLAAEHVG